MKNFIHKKQGFTLIEMLLYVSISAVILMAVFLFLIILLQARLKNQTIAEVDQQGLAAAYAITQALRNADAVTSPTIGASGASLTLDVVNAANDPTIFDLSSGRLRIKEGAGAAVFLTNSQVIVSGLSFSNLSRVNTPTIVRVNFIVTYNNASGRNEFDYQKSFVASASIKE